MNILFCPRAQFDPKEIFWCKCQKTLGEHFPKEDILKKGQKTPGEHFPKENILKKGQKAPGWRTFDLLEVFFACCGTTCFCRN